MRFSRAIGSDTQILKGGLSDTESVKECAQSILDEINSLKPFWREHVRAHIMLLLARLQRLGVICVLEPKDMNHVNKIKPVLDFINESYMNHIGTAQMAELVGLNETYFYRIFKKFKGCTPRQYKEFLKNNDYEPASFGKRYDESYVYYVYY